MNTELIAEIGSNWWRPDPVEAKAYALKCVGEAADHGATAVKFQLFRADRLYSRERAPKLHARCRRFELPASWLPDLHQRAKRSGLAFWLSIFDELSLQEALPWADCLKIASGDLTHFPLIAAAAEAARSRDLALCLSTGAGTLDELVMALYYGCGLRLLWIFHCLSSYPAPAGELHLRALRALSVAPTMTGMGDPSLPSRIRIGWSDHSGDPLACVLAVALGAGAVEAHLKLPDVHPLSPDAGNHSWPLHRFASLRRWLEKAEIMLGEARKIPQPSELPERVWARRGADGLRPAMRDDQQKNHNE